MKRQIMFFLMTVLTVMPSMAQYGRLPHGRRVAPYYHLDYHDNTYRPRMAADHYYGLRLGIDVTTVSADNRFLDGGSPKTGLNAGVVAGVQLAPATPVYLETGLLYMEKGGKGSHGSSYTYNMNYLEVPFLMKYCYRADPLTSIQPFAGVYCAAGISGSIKEQDRRVAHSAFDDNAFGRFDAGLRIGCGLQFDHLYAEVGYDVGLANVSRDDFETAHTGCLFATVGVNF